MRRPGTPTPTVAPVSSFTGINAVLLLLGICNSLVFLCSFQTLLMLFFLFFLLLFAVVTVSCFFISDLLSVIVSESQKATQNH